MCIFLTPTLLLDRPPLQDPFLVGELATAMAQGLRSQNVAATAKHWAVYSVPKGGRDGHARTDPHVARRELEALHLLPWRKLIKEGAIQVRVPYLGLYRAPL